MPITFSSFECSDAVALLTAYAGIGGCQLPFPLLSVQTDWKPVDESPVELCQLPFPLLSVQTSTRSKSKSSGFRCQLPFPLLSVQTP